MYFFLFNHLLIYLFNYFFVCLPTGMLHYITLRYITLYYIILYYIILYYIILYYIILLLTSPVSLHFSFSIWMFFFHTVLWRLLPISESRDRLHDNNLACTIFTNGQSRHTYLLVRVPIVVVLILVPLCGPLSATL